MFWNTNLLFAFRLILNGHIANCFSLTYSLCVKRVNIFLVSIIACFFLTTNRHLRFLFQKYTKIQYLTTSFQHIPKDVTCNFKYFLECLIFIKMKNNGLFLTILTIAFDWGYAKSKSIFCHIRSCNTSDNDSA